jgi:hypothetical protein
MRKREKKIPKKKNYAKGIASSSKLTCDLGVKGAGERTPESEILGEVNELYY